MLLEYVDAAMRKASYEILPNGSYYGEIAGFQGVYAIAASMETCREEFREVLEG